MRADLALQFLLAIAPFGLIGALIFAASINDARYEDNQEHEL